MAGEFIDIPARDGGTFQGYLALPEGGRGPGLMILQEIFGVNEAIRATCDYFAEEGYVVLAPDMFHRLQTRVELGYSDAEFATAFGYFQRRTPTTGAVRRPSRPWCSSSRPIRRRASPRSRADART